MSTIKVTNIEHGSTTDGGIQLDSIWSRHKLTVNSCRLLAR